MEKNPVKKKDNNVPNLKATARKPVQFYAWLHNGILCNFK